MSVCIHCGQEVSNFFYAEKAHCTAGPFCCKGCLTVYNIINMRGLSEYYSIKKDIVLLKKRMPVEMHSTHYLYLDDKDFHKEYTYQSLLGLPTMDFYLEGIHCLACLWIIEKLPSFVKGVKSSKLNMSKSVVTVSIKEDGKFSAIAKELDNIGYHPHPLKRNQKTNDFKIKENRSMLLRIGVAGAASGNIMLYAIALYAGAGIEYRPVFNALTVIFSIPVLTYCAFPFYKASYLVLKNSDISIDVPISLALVMGAIMGIYNLSVGIYENYFDSLTALVFLLLMSRYFLKIIQEKGMSTSDLNFFYYGESVLKMGNCPLVFNEIHPKSIKVNDILKIFPNQMIPADGTVFSGESYLNTSLLTGESQLQKVKTHDEIYSGTMNVGNEILMKVTGVNKSTRLGQILKSVEDGWGQRAKIVDITNVISKYFVTVVFILAVVLFILEMRLGNTKHAVESALTLLIVTCPCALAIATPLTFIRTLSKNAQKGIIIKDDAVIEKLSLAKNVFIDKTGTLTLNESQVSTFIITGPTLTPIQDVIYSLEKNSKHPIGKSLKNYIVKNFHGQFNEREIQELKELPGIGISGFISNQFYEIKHYGVYENGILKSLFATKDKIRPDALAAIKKLKNLKLNVKILSGDKKEFVEELAFELGLNSNEFLAELSPEEKSDVIKSSPNSVMIGDGANDSIALSFADIGIAVHGAMDISLRAADVFLNFPGLDPVVNLIITSKETMKVVYRNLFLSLIYNCISVTLAFTGQISPLVAAIIMPLSSLSVLISTLIGTKELRKQWRL